MLDAGILKRRQDKKYQSNPEPLVEELEKDLIEKQNKVLTESDKLRLLGMLRNSFFREIISIEIRKEQRAVH